MSSNTLANGQEMDQSISKAELTKTIKQVLSIVVAPEQLVELRILGVNGKRTDSGYFTDMTKLAQSAARYDGNAEGIYITLNPVNSELVARSSNRIREFAKHATSDNDITQRQWILVDFDPVRPAGISSSNEEHQAAIERASICGDWLKTQEIGSILADSGNGAHLLIPARLPNTSDSLKLVKGLLDVINTKFSDDAVKVDTSTSNASRIFKLYGTLVCKGDSIPHRPHRRAWLLSVPEELPVAPTEALKALVAGGPKQTQDYASGYKSGNLGLSYGKAAFQRELTILSSAPGVKRQNH